MKQEHEELILKACEAESLQIGEKIQTLWSGYGEIIRVHLQGCDRPSVVVKHVKFPQNLKHPRGWNSDISHQRKVRSYQVESHWYQSYTTNEHCRVPICLASQSFGDEQLIVLEDLNVAGFPERKNCINDAEMKACLSWIANFHGLFLGVSPEGLWSVGTYWHLATRPEELEAMSDQKLKAAAAEIDNLLNNCRFTTILHGDAKIANFCFSKDGLQIAAVDFQYVGGGCGMKDVIYFLGSCMNERDCERKVPGLLDHYFSELRISVGKKANFPELEKEWRSMFAFAWTDFHRFLLGWMPGHHKVNKYSKSLVQEVLNKLKQS
ncbi:uncharacterized protein pkdc [Triplophysa dalaica]|uniref:uncharacterized protein pkdc n=1 Tax=Triplophysa dalaica TaxID=1582913 RepID=UPI0024DF911E|nr:uncharacterized protein pkdc [Triplophysa dalaica]